MAVAWRPGSGRGPRGPWGCCSKPCPARIWIISCSGPRAHGDPAPLFQALEKLADLLAFFHSRPVPALPVAPQPALAYLDKVMAQLLEAGLLTREDWQVLTRERHAWAERFQEFSDRQVLIHGDATPTNFLFPNGRAVALDLERLRNGDRLWDLSWVAGELRHAWGWRTADFSGSEAAIRYFFRMYLACRGS